MNKNLFLILLILTIISCKKEQFVTEFYPNGNIKLKVQINKDSIQNGTYEEYYENGELKSKTNYVNGLITDSLFNFYENGLIKDKGTVKNNFPNGWWNYYRFNGQLKEKTEWILVKDSLHKNQTIYFDQKGNIKYGTSSFFELKIPDTIRLDKNIARFNYHSNFNVYKKLIYVVVENKYSENETKLDTFGIKDNDFWFGVYGYKKGKQNIKGQIVEELYEIKSVGNDSAIGTVSNHKKYFEKEVYVSDKNN
jgi:hypothetical protein